MWDPSPSIANPSSREEWEAAIPGEWDRRERLLMAAAESVELRQELWLACRDDPVFFLDNFAWTTDPRRLENGEDPMTPLVLWPFQREVVGAMASWRLLGVDKPRDMGLSIVALGVMAWGLLFKQGARFGVSSTKMAKICDGLGANPTPDSLFGKLVYMLRHLPEWMASEGSDWAFSRGQGAPVVSCPAMSSSIIGEVATPDAFHGPRLTAVLYDETARIRDMATIVRGVMGATNSIWCITTPAGPVGWWPRLKRGEGAQTQRYGDGEPKPGHWQMLTLDISQDPRKDEDWEAEKRASMTEADFAEQYEVNYDANHLPGRIWPEFARMLHVYDPTDWGAAVGEGLLRGTWVVEAWDPGLHTAVVWVAYSPQWQRAVVLDYRIWHDCSYDQIVEDVARAGWACLPDENTADEEVQRLGRTGRRPRYRVIDRAGNARIAGMQTTARRELERRGIKLESVRNDRVDEGNAKVAQALRYERLHFAPQCALPLARERHGNVPTLVECVAGYRKDIKAETVEDHVGDDPLPVKDRYSHAADVLRYAVQKIWGGDGAGQKRWDDDLSAWVDAYLTEARDL